MTTIQAEERIKQDKAKASSLSTWNIFFWVMFGLFILVYGIGLVFLVPILLIAKKKKNLIAESKRLESDIMESSASLEIPKEIEQSGKTYKLCYDYDNYAVAHPDFSSLKMGSALRLVKEPDNPYDKKAIALFSDSGQRVAYLFRGESQDMASDWLKKGYPVLCWVANKMDGKARISYYVPKPTFEEAKKDASDENTFLVINCEGPQEQLNIGATTVGEQLTVETSEADDEGGDDGHLNDYFLKNSKGMTIGQLNETVAQLFGKIERATIYVLKISMDKRGVYKAQLVIEK